MNLNKIAVVYVRVSTDRQIDNYSVQDQRALAVLAGRYGFKQVETREEQGISAETITQRAVMKGILEDISNGKVGAIIVSSFTRLTRDIDDIDGRIIKKTCRDNDCVIITPEKLYDFSNEADDDLADLQFFFSKIQKRMNLKPMIRGEYIKAKNGGFVGLPLSVGYDFTWKEQNSPKGKKFVADLVINPAEAEVVRYIHQLFPTMLYRQVATHLNELVGQGKMMPFPLKSEHYRKKYKSTHRPWRDADVRYIISNDLYVGRMQYGVHAKSPYLRGLDPVFSYRPDLRILTDEIFEQNQSIAAARRRVSARTKGNPHLFSSILRCPHCGSVMAGHRRQRPHNRHIKHQYDYQCAEYQRSGSTACRGYYLPEREVLNVFFPIFLELLQKNLRDHLHKISESNSLQSQIEGEVKAKLAEVDTAMKNLIEAVKHGALKYEQVKADNEELEETRRRLQKRLEDTKSLIKMQRDLRAMMEIFDHDLDRVMSDLLENRLRFNLFVRSLFSAMVVELDRPGMGWRKGKMKGDLPVCNPRISKVALSPEFLKFIDETGMELPESLKRIELYVENRSESHGSPLI